MDQMTTLLRRNPVRRERVGALLQILSPAAAAPRGQASILSNEDDGWVPCRSRRDRSGPCRDREAGNCISHESRVLAKWRPDPRSMI